MNILIFDFVLLFIVKDEAVAVLELLNRDEPDWGCEVLEDGLVHPDFFLVDGRCS